MKTTARFIQFLVAFLCALGGHLSASPTPNMDALAAAGVRFTDGYSSGCVCSPEREGLLTGRYQARTGHDANPNRPGRLTD
jgi:arylsulfatase A-like enzyme